jgi:microcystin-dependent protein
MNIVSSDLTSNNLTFKVNSVDAIKVATNGNVGIWTTTPSTTFDVSGAVKFRGALDMTSQKITNVASPTTTTDVATKSYVDIAVDIAMPIGGIIMWSGAMLPTNWGLCDGSTYGSVVSPDLRGRFVLSSGQGSGLTNRTLGQTGGAETHTLTVAEMPSHNHSITDPGHDHYINFSWDQGNPGAGSVQYNLLQYQNASITMTGKNYTGITINSKGNDSAHNNMPPFYVLAFIIRFQ